MVDERIVELLNKEIDGVILPAERVILEEYRATNPEVEVMAAELRAVASALADVGQVEAPSTLKGRVMRQLNLQPRQQVPLADRLLSPVWEFFRGASGVRLAYAFSLGLVAGIALFALYIGSRDQQTFQPTDATGALILGSSAGRVEVGPVVPISSGQIKGAIGTQFTNTLTILNIKLTSPGALHAQVTFDPSVLTVRAIQRGSEGETGLAAHGNTVEIQSSGNDDYTIYFLRKSPAPGPVRVALFAANDLVFERNITVSQPVQ